jgi:hypothetical protein
MPVDRQVAVSNPPAAVTRTPVKAGGSAGAGHQCSGAHRDREAIVHQRLLLTNMAPGGLTGSLTEPSSILVHPIRAASSQAARRAFISSAA